MPGYHRLEAGGNRGRVKPAEAGNEMSITEAPNPRAPEFFRLTYCICAPTYATLQVQFKPSSGRLGRIPFPPLDSGVTRICRVLLPRNM